jgi:hypothetical protein
MCDEIFNNMCDETYYLDWNSITNNFLYIVPIGRVDDAHYYNQSTVELTEVAQKLCEVAGLPFDALNKAIYAVFCWAFRNYDALQTCQMNGVLFFENVVILNTPVR